VKAEAMMAMKLSHPNIATVRSFEEDEGGNPFLVMDYIEGEPLDDILAERGPLGEEETVKLLGPVAAALDYAHSQGVVHRDVKPGNVMVRKDGTPFVLDFGIAREIQETMTMVTGKLSSGTLLYMSPEQLKGRAPKAAQDVYSFAAMAYECLAGRPPFSRGQIEWQIVNDAPEELPESVGDELRQGVMAGLAKEAGKRPGSCAGVLGRTGKDGDSESRKADHESRFVAWIVPWAKTAKWGGMLVAGIVVLNMAIAIWKELHEKTPTWYMKAAAKGNVEAQLHLGRLYEEGMDIEQSDAEAAKWYREAAEQGDAVAQGNLGLMYEEGRGVEQSDAEAVKWYQKAAEQGDARAQSNLGLMCEEGRGVEQSDEEAVKWFRKAGEQGDTSGQNRLGSMYANGRGVEQSDEEAVKWFRKAAEQGHARAQRNLGVMYANGRGVKQSDTEAVKWYRKAVEQGDVMAYINLGAMYESGRGVQQSDIAAVKWYRKAAEQGDAVGQVELGIMFRKGRGVEEDCEEAVKWFRKAAEQGNAAGQDELAWAYLHGLGVAQSDEEAVKWYQKAAEQGDAEAQFRLGTMYEDGRGVVKSHAEAEKWYRKAAQQGDDRAKFALRLMDAKRAEQMENETQTEERRLQGGAERE
jgi:TPR repeat protein